MSPHLFVALSAHGYGHAAQTAAVINALRDRHPGLRLTLQSALPPAFLRSRFEGDFEHLAEDTDVGVVMSSALDVEREATRAAYRRFHAGWKERLARAEHRLRSLAPDLVLANVPYLILAAARRAEIPCVAMCSLNWADIYAGYYGADELQASMQAAYAGASLFLRLTPGMPMDDLPNAQTVGPVARIGRDRRAELRSRLALEDDTGLVLIAPGGTELRLPIECWPRHERVHFIVPAGWNARAPNVSDFEALAMPFIDVLRSSDAVIGKPGYGTFAEAACNGVPMLYVRRADDWPEEPYLIEWFGRHARAAEIERAALERGELAQPLAALWRRAPVAAPRPAGVEQASEHIARLLADATR